MIGIVLTGHGNFASGLSSSLKLIVGIPENFRSVDFLPEDSIEELTGKIEAAMEELHTCDQLLVLTDLKGGSPYNVATKLRLQKGLDKVAVVAGTNLPCLIEASMGTDTQDVKAFAQALVKSTREQVELFRTEEESAAVAQPAKRRSVRPVSPDAPDGKIVHARVDERLIHGQVAMVWTNTVGASRIVVVNDQAIGDEMILSGLKMAKPAGVHVSVLSVKRAVQRLKENAYPGDRIFVITKNIADMAELVRQGVAIETVNVGNVAKREGSRNIKKSVNLTQQDIDDINEIVSLGHTVTAQMIPNEPAQSILSFL